MKREFIAAKESPLFTWLFTEYAKNLFKRRFKAVWINQQYQPLANNKTVYFLNHTSWWDGIIPLLLNAQCFNQQPRAMMEHGQMKKHPFFKKIGVFSIDTSDSGHIRQSLRFAVDSMQRKKASLFIYPEGEIKPTTQPIQFSPGIGWLFKQLPEVDFVPIGIHMHTIRHDKPELHLWVGKASDLKDEIERKKIVTEFEDELTLVRKKLVKSAGFDDHPYEKLL